MAAGQAMKPRRTLRWSLAIAAALALALIVPPFVNLGRYRVQIASAMSAALGRRVEVGRVSLVLLPAPGVEAANVVIADDPAFGLEPFARAGLLRARFRLRSLLTGRLSLSALEFSEPSLNLARRRAAGGETVWNIGALLGRASGPLPYLGFAGGRINFKEGDRKGAFFFSNVDLAVFVEGGRLRLRFRGQPARTDRRLTGAGEIAAEGQLGPALDSPLSLRVQMTGAFLSDFLALARGSDPGLQGGLGWDIQVAGRIEDLRLAGTMEVSRLHRWDVPPPRQAGSLESRLAGRANLVTGSFELLELSLENDRIRGRGTVTGLFDEPRLELNLTFADAEAERLLAALQRFAPRISPQLRVDGRLEGGLRLVAAAGAEPAAEGRITLRNLRLDPPQGPAVQIPAAVLDFNGPLVRLRPVDVPLDRAGQLTVSWAGDWTTPVRGWRRLELALAGKNVALRGVRPLAAAAGVTQLPDSGRISCDLRVEWGRERPAFAFGAATVSRVSWSPAWLPRPAVLHTARITLLRDQVRVDGLVASLGDTTVTGSARGTILAGRPWQAELHTVETGVAALAGLWNAPLPAAPVRGRFTVDRFRLRRWWLENLESAFVLAGDRLTLRDTRAQVAGGTAAGHVMFQLGKAKPEFTAQIKLTEVAAEQLESLVQGRISGLLALHARGATPAEIASSLALEGHLSGKSLVLADANLARILDREHLDAFEAAFSVRDSQIRLARLTLNGAGPALEASGAIGFDRRLSLDFRTFRVEGTLADPRRLAARDLARAPSR
jgi:uncharacterized protein involved in outer membrane biogenesis